MRTPTQTFPALGGIADLRHVFVLRQPGVDTRTERSRALAELRSGFEGVIDAMGFSHGGIATAEQVHGGEVAMVERGTGLEAPIAGVDGLITTNRGVLLGIYVADCCAVYLADRRGRAVGLVHSGKKGSEARIAVRAIAMLGDLGIHPSDLIVQLSPCIRPPAYEVDFAAQIRRDCRDAGVPGGQIHDSGECTSRDLERYYSYRVERGQTGRMLALLGFR